MNSHSLSVHVLLLHDLSSPCLPSVFPHTLWLILSADLAPLGTKLFVFCLYSSRILINLFIKDEILCSVSAVMHFPLHIPYSLKESWSEVFYQISCYWYTFLLLWKRVWCLISAYAVNGTSILAKIWLLLRVWPRKDNWQPGKCNSALQVSTIISLKIIFSNIASRKYYIWFWNICFPSEYGHGLIICTWKKRHFILFLSLDWAQRMNNIGSAPWLTRLCTEVNGFYEHDNSIFIWLHPMNKLILNPLICYLISVNLPSKLL